MCQTICLFLTMHNDILIIIIIGYLIFSINKQYSLSQFYDKVNRNILTLVDCGFMVALILP